MHQLGKHSSIGAEQPLNCLLHILHKKNIIFLFYLKGFIVIELIVSNWLLRQLIFLGHFPIYKTNKDLFKLETTQFLTHFSKLRPKWNPKWYVWSSLHFLTLHHFVLPAHEILATRLMLVLFKDFRGSNLFSESREAKQMASLFTGLEHTRFCSKLAFFCEFTGPWSFWLSTSTFKRESVTPDEAGLEIMSSKCFCTRRKAPCEMCMFSGLDPWGNNLKCAYSTK